MDAKNLYEGIGRLISVSSARELQRPVSRGGDGKSKTENGDLVSVENGVSSVEQTEDGIADEKEQKSSPSMGDSNPSE